MLKKLRFFFPVISKKNKGGKIVQTSCYMLALSIIFTGQAIACYCNDIGQMQAPSGLSINQCNKLFTCELLPNGDQNVSPTVVCGKNGCSGPIGNDCYCNVTKKPPMGS